MNGINYLKVLGLLYERKIIISTLTLFFPFSSQTCERCNTDDSNSTSTLHLMGLFLVTMVTDSRQSILSFMGQFIITMDICTSARSRRKETEENGKTNEQEVLVKRTLGFFRII